MVKVLVVDDNEGVLDQLTMYLQDQHEVFTAADSEDAKVVFQNEGPDVLLVDNVLPGGRTGIDLIKDFVNSSQFCVGILMTGQSSRETILKAVRSGAFDYIEKPVERNELDGAHKTMFKFISFDWFLNVIESS